MAGARNRESGDHIRGCGGACVHVVDFLAEAGGWSITKVAALLIFLRLFPDDPAYARTAASAIRPISRPPEAGARFS